MKFVIRHSVFLKLSVLKEYEFDTIEQAEKWCVDNSKPNDFYTITHVGNVLYDIYKQLQKTMPSKSFIDGLIKDCINSKKNLEIKVKKIEKCDIFYKFYVEIWTNCLYGDTHEATGFIYLNDVSDFDPVGSFNKFQLQGES